MAKNKNQNDIENIRLETLKQFHVAFGLMTIIPLLLCIYLITVQLLSLDVLTGLNGAYFLFMIVISLLGLLVGRIAILKVIQRLDFSRQSIKSLINENPDGMIVVNKEKNISFINPSAEILLNKKNIDLIGQPFEFPLIPGEKNEIELSSKSGQTRYVELRVVETKYQEKGIGGRYLVSMRDMTERKLMEDKLRDSEAKFRTVFENSAVAISVADSEERLISWNKFMEDLLDMGPDDLYHKPISSMYPKEEWKKILSIDYHRSDTNHHLETVMIKKDGSAIDVDVSISVLKDSEENITGFIGIMRDVTERKKAEAKIKESEAKFRTVFENSAVAITLADSEERLISWNKFMEGLLDMGRDDLYHKPISSLYPEEEWKKMRSLNIRRSGMRQHLETVMIKRGGQTVDVNVSISVLKDGEGNITGSIGIISDITERKKAEEALRKSKKELEVQTWGLKKTNDAVKLLYKELEKKNEELRKIDQLKSDFISIVSHELRTPLTTIKETVLQTLEGILGPTTEDQREFMSICLEDINRLARIIDNLLDISKIEAGKVELKRESVQFISLIKQVTAFLGSKANAKGLEIKVIEPQKEITVFLDVDKIKQVLTNLIGNSMKFTKKGHIEISAKELEDEIECAVKDTGIGMSREDLEKVFGKFQQFGRIDGAGEKGTGLGLSISKGIVELHKGRIWVESELGKGTSFIFTLPKCSGRQLFDEELSKEIENAKRNDTHLSVLIFEFEGFDEFKNKSGEQKTSAVMNGLACLVKENLRREGDAAFYDAYFIYIILPATGGEESLAVSSRLKKALDRHLADIKVSDTLKVVYKTANFPEDGSTEKEFLSKINPK